MSAAEKELYERLASQAAVDTDDDRAGTPIRGVAIGAGDVTKGASGTRTRWPADVLEAAAEALAGEEVPVVEGPGGETGHYPLSEALPADALAGTVEFDFTEGVGLTYTGEVVDESLARKIDAGALEVSPDMLRRLDDDGAGVAEATEILDIPRLTLVARGAGPSASVEVADGAEALAEYLSGPDPEAEQLAAAALTQSDLLDRRVGESDVALLARRAGVDATEHNNEREVRAAARDGRGADDEVDTDANPGTTAYRLAKRRQSGGSDADKGFKERLAEQGGSMSTESHAAPSPGPSSRDDGEADEIEQLAKNSLGTEGIRACMAEDISAAEYIRQLGVDPAEYDDSSKLSRARSAAEKNRRR